MLVTLTPVAAAQDVAVPGPRPSELRGAAAPGPLRQPLSIDSVVRDIQPTEWKKGAAIGGLTLGLAYGLLWIGLLRTALAARAACPSRLLRAARSAD